MEPPEQSAMDLLKQKVSDLEKAVISRAYVALLAVAMIAISAASTAATAWLNKSVTTVENNVPTPAVNVQVQPAPLFPDMAPQPMPAQAQRPVDYVPTFGWVPPSDAEKAANLDPAKTLQFSNTDAGKVVQGDVQDVFFWPAVRKAAGKAAPWYCNVNQGQVGCCVGAGTSEAVTHTIAMQVLAGQGGWKQASPEVIYAGSRVEIGGGRLRGDGSIGAWAAKWCTTFGIVPMEKFPAADLSEFSPARARQWGSSGVPKDLETVAHEHPVKSAALVKTWADVAKAISQGYAISVCSSQGFTMTRDGDGFASPQGTWPHCMAIIGVRGGNKPGAFILNSWGDQAHTGPVWPADAPVSGFWADQRTIEKMVGEGDSFAYAGVEGFVKKRVNWFADSRPAVRDLLRLQPGREPVYALAP